VLFPVASRSDRSAARCPGSRTGAHVDHHDIDTGGSISRRGTADRDVDDRRGVEHDVENRNYPPADHDDAPQPPDAAEIDHHEIVDDDLDDDYDDDNRAAVSDG
jgi:hypothetical protein